MTDQSMTSQTLTKSVAPGLLRRLGAIFYDSLLLTALVFVATAAITLPLGNPSGLWLLFFQIFLFEIIPLVFFCWFWISGGQTLGMRAWRLKLVSMEGQPVDWRQALKRHFAAILSLLVFGLGFLWIVFDSDKLAWHDRLSGTRLILIKN
ncbi:MAG: RDD family protein [Candidatus Thiodiazotropha sp.]|nr:RDD family protein [Chromatiales bacterium]